ncbi:MAG TPA: maleylpyruvate isomerase N-terminal domain-containing protein [Chloroflexota bacterium]|nr:maleylpyruvate isomerase N-terminal domain-containing protein [Chloroflexota bacterium]
MEKHEYVQALHRETDALLGVARAGLDLPVPSCPGWMVGDVLAHVGQAMNWMREIVESRTQSALRNDPNKHSFDWHRPGVLDWYV